MAKWEMRSMFGGAEDFSNERSIEVSAYYK
jgi:hypothetical protein